MASAASGGNIGVIHGGVRIGRGQDLVRASMTVLAVSRRRAIIGWLGVQTARIGILCIGMTLGACDLLRSGVMHQTLDIRVAIDAGEEITVDGMLQLGFIHKEANLFAVGFCGQGGVRVAGEAVFIVELLLRVCYGRDKQA
ncbi:MAG: hypothetical protein ABR907_13705 [Terracidiphilus sp.]|jgi:hypothetical protein